MPRKSYICILLLVIYHIGFVIVQNNNIGPIEDLPEMLLKDKDEHHYRYILTTQNIAGPIRNGDNNSEVTYENASIEIWHYDGGEFDLRVSLDGPTLTTPMLITDVIVDSDRVYPLGTWNWYNAGILYFDVNNIENDTGHVYPILPLTHDDYIHDSDLFLYTHDPAFITMDVHDGDIYAITYSENVTKVEESKSYFYVFGLGVWEKGEHNYTGLYKFRENFNGSTVWWQETPFGRFCRLRYFDGLVFVPIIQDGSPPSYRVLIFNVSDPSNIELLANFSRVYDGLYYLHHEYVTVLPVGDYLYVGKTYGELDIWDISDLRNPVNIRNIELNASIFDMKYDQSRGIVYIAGGISGLIVMNASNKSNPRILDRYNATLKCSLGVEIINESLIAVGDSVFGVKILNTSDPSGICIVSYVKTKDRAYHMTYYDDRLFVGDMTGGICVINISDPERPTYLCSKILTGAILQYKYNMSSMIGGSWDSPGVFLHFSSGKIWYYQGDPTDDCFAGFNLDIYPRALVIYNDTNGDGKLTFDFISYSNNPSLLGEQSGAVDQVYCVASMWYGESFIPPDTWVLENVTIDNIRGIKASTEINNITLTSNPSPPIIPVMNDSLWLGESAQANVTLTVLFLPRIVIINDTRILNTTVKFGFEIEFYDLNLTGNPENFSVYVDFRIEHWGGTATYGGYPAYSVIEGHDIPKFSLICVKEMGFVSTNSSAIIINNGNKTVQNVTITNDYEGRYLEFTEATYIGINIHNVTSISKIYYDPQITTWVGGIKAGTVNNPPVIEMLAPCDGAIFNTTSITMRWNAWDPEGDIDHFELYVDGEIVDRNIPSDQTDYTIVLSDGIHSIEIWAVDVAGNTAVYAVEIMVDTLPPTIMIETPEDGAILDTTTLVVVWSSSDNMSGIDHFELYVDGEIVDQNIPSNQTNYTVIVHEGKHDICIIAIDRAGNSASCSISFTVRVHHFPIYFVVPIVVLIITVAVILWFREKRK